MLAPVGQYVAGKIADSRSAWQPIIGDAGVTVAGVVIQSSVEIVGTVTGLRGLRSLVGDVAFTLPETGALNGVAGGPPVGLKYLAPAASAVPEGVVYSRTDLNGKILPYGGQAKSEARFLERQIEHSREYPNADFEFTAVSRATPGAALDVAEHLYVQSLTGGVRASKSPLVSNLRDPVGSTRRPMFGLPAPRNE